ncbi:ubiquinol-cytochrome C chaperone family protein [Azospirillum argentinense]|uniref:Ubiquinol-cytochrome C chaperone family protein n=1 Tax=Azospirillum argentinense TaxID=2970906 RepID=A0ABW8V0X4_9PROT|nr:ubiquinol-cytochrome C chaperone family protein [Azospirillum argentinense]MBK3799905.1 ubiquinol-cytochrome C chaperone [Azospirillum argentinense]
MLDRLFRRRREARAVADFYLTIAAQARRPAFYRDLGVPDTLDGRFDMVVLHVFLVMRRLKGQGAAAADRSRLLFEAMIDHFEKSLMEQGVGDSGVGRRIKTMARGIAGRIEVYDRALADEGEQALEVALDNNVYGTVSEVPPERLAVMAAYVRREAAGLETQPLESLMAGEVRFGPPPGVGTD